MKIKAEVLVVGGGPAGATVARLLAASGVEVCLIERDLEHYKPCGGGMPDILYREFDLPLPPEYRATKSIKIFSPSGREMLIELEGGQLVTVNRRSFDRMLRQKASQEGALVLQGIFLKVKDKDKYLTVEVLLEGQKRVFEARYIVAADGVNSSVRRALGLKPIRSVYTLSKRSSEMNTGHCQFWFSTKHAPRFYSWIFPAPEGVSIGTGTFHSRDARDLFRNFLDRAGLKTDTHNLKGYRIPQWQEYEYFHDGVFFVGDAAGQVMPFTYEGIYYCMKSAQFVAEAIIKDRPSLYRKLWRKRFYSRFRLMDRIQRYFYRSDERIEKLFDIFQNPKVQKASMRLWLEKDTSRGALLSYINIFKRFLP